MLAPAPDAPQEFCASVVPASTTAEGERVLEALQALATKLRAKRAYTNTATFDLKCEVRVFHSLPSLLVVVEGSLMDRFRFRVCAVCRWYYCRCVVRALRVRKRRARMRLRQGMSSLANTETGYPSILTTGVMYPL